MHQWSEYGEALGQVAQRNGECYILESAQGQVGLWAAWSTGRLPAHGKGLELDELEGPFKPKSFHNSVISPN